jgi:hypothetical protein
MNEVGTGKTFTYAFSIQLALCQLRQEKAEGHPIEARPTLVAMPAQLLPQTFDEVSKFFPELKIYTFFQSQNQIAGQDKKKRHDSCVTAMQLEQLLLEWDTKTGDPETAANVVFTTYNTMSKRWLDVDNGKYDTEKHPGPHALDGVDPWVKGYKGIDPNQASDDEEDDNPEPDDTLGADGDVELGDMEEEDDLDYDGEELDPAEDDDATEERTDNSDLWK